MKMEERNVGSKGKRPKQGPTNANDLPMELPFWNKYQIQFSQK